MQSISAKFIKISSIAVFAATFLFSSSNLAKAQDLPLGSLEEYAAVEFKRLKDLQTELEKIPMEKMAAEPHKSFLKKHEKETLYSEPAGQWHVRSELFWSLRARFRKLPIAEEIAWTAAQNPLPGECEGYINCYIYIISVTNARYLSYYPIGKYSKKALSEIVERLKLLTADGSQYDGPTDAADRAELQKMLAELKQQISGTKNVDKNRTLPLIAKLQTKYK